MQKRRLRNELNNWDDVRFFLAVLESGSFSGAGERLRVDQTTVGRRLAEMEKRLGAKLFDRHGKGMRPTPAARGMSEQAGRMAAAAATIERRLSGIDGEMAGIVRIAVTEGLASGWLTPQLSDFQLAHPGILLEVISGDQPLDLGTREADVAIRLVRPEAPQIVVQRMGVMRFALYAAPAYESLFGLPQSIDELFQHCLIDHTGYHAASSLGPWRDIASRHEHVVYRTNSSYAYQRAISAGLGIGMHPTYTPKIFPDLLAVPIELDMQTEIWLISHEETNQGVRTRAVIEHIRELFRRDQAEWFT
ncbi:MAG TPA: LysR family transcriptional regulator [Alphaproteobacteria bacterium]|nr:LysR family transcriptional regulator [Alphaproteobacteria bacterium]